MKLFAALCLVFLVKISSLDSKTLKFDQHGEMQSDYASQLLGISKQQWDYVEVRPGAHMFYWLYHTTNPRGALDSPMVMWLQGGPGGSSTGFGNFEEIGPLDVNLRPRKTTWLSQASLLFVDNPVGTGYSYVDDVSKLTTNVSGIAADLLTLFGAFLDKAPEFKKVPFYIFSESYGGKMTAAFSQVLYQAIKSGSVECNFRGFAMGDSWIEPVYSTDSWASYLLGSSLVDSMGFSSVSTAAKKVSAAVSEGDFQEAFLQWGELEDVVETVTGGVNFYNILKWQGSEMRGPRKYITYRTRAQERLLGKLHADDLAALMNGPIKKMLKIIPANVTWGGQSGDVIDAQSRDFMVPVSKIVDALLRDTPLQVVVYSGQLDLIVDVVGTEAWVYRLKNLGKGFPMAPREKVSVDSNPAYFRKCYKNFCFFWVLDAGHMVPADNGPGALRMLQDIIFP